jgi:hypothetical protein
VSGGFADFSPPLLSRSKSGDQPVISSPEKYAGRTLERHLQLYDWKNEYDAFDRAIKTSSFDGICNSAFVSSRVSPRQRFRLTEL